MRKDQDPLTLFEELPPVQLSGVEVEEMLGGVRASRRASSLARQRRSLRSRRRLAIAAAVFPLVVLAAMTVRELGPSSEMVSVAATPRDEMAGPALLVDSLPAVEGKDDWVVSQQMSDGEVDMVWVDRIGP